MGQIYVEVSGNVANGIRTMNTSSGGYEDGGAYWINWTYEGGFTATGWANSWVEPLASWWGTNCTSYHKEDGSVYSSSPEDFALWMTSENAPENLNDALGDERWSNTDKWAYLQANDNVMDNCTTPA